MRSFSRPFYEEIDRRFFDTVKRFMPWKKIPFDNLLDFSGDRREVSFLKSAWGWGATHS